MLQDWGDDVAVSIDDAPGVCMYVVDANKDAKNVTKYDYGESTEVPTLAKLSGINHKSMDNTDTWGDIRIENYVRR